MRIKLSIFLSLNEIALATDGIIKKSSKGKIIKYITTDSRIAMPGDLYFAFRGEKYDGELFIKEAASKGALTVSEKSASADLLVENTEKAFLSLAGYYKKLLPALKYTVAITGSVGKTTTKEILYFIAKNDYVTYATKGNMNNRIGMSATILSAPENTELLILEMGMNHSGEIRELSESAMPDIAIITKIGTAHIGHFGSIEEIEKAKSEIICGLSGGILITPENALKSCEYKKVTFSSENTTADYSISYANNTISIKKKQSVLIIPTKLKWQRHNLECLCGAVALSDKLKIAEKRIKTQISLISNDIFRQIYIKHNGYTILDDSYNASLESVISAIDELCSNKGYRRYCAALGQIFELGDSSAYIHYKIGCYAARKNVSPLFLFGKDTKYIKLGAINNGADGDEIFSNDDLTKPEITASQISDCCADGDIILFKGSHKANLKSVINILVMGESNE